MVPPTERPSTLSDGFLHRLPSHWVFASALRIGNSARMAVQVGRPPSDSPDPGRRRCHPRTVLAPGAADRPDRPWGRGDLWDGAWVAEATGMIDLTGWPDESRLILRKERPHPGVQLTYTDVDGMRITALLTSTPAGIVPGKAAGLDCDTHNTPRSRPDPGCQGNRAAQPALPRHQPERRLARDRAHRSRPGPTADGGYLFATSLDGPGGAMRYPDGSTRQPSIRAVVDRQEGERSPSGSSATKPRSGRDRRPDRMHSIDAIARALVADLTDTPRGQAHPGLDAPARLQQVTGAVGETGFALEHCLPVRGSRPLRGTPGRVLA